MEKYEGMETERADRRAWLGLWVVVSGVLLVVADASVVNVAFPELSDELETSDDVLSWVISGYNISVAAFLLLAGRMADRYGRRRVFEIGIATFTVFSLLCALSLNVEMLIVFRILQAVGGAAIFPASLALVIPSFPPRQRATAIGIWGAMGGVGAALGPALGGILLNFFSWRSIFVVNIPIGIAILIFSRKIFKESKDVARVGKLDALGVPAGTLGIALIMVGLVQGENWGYLDWRTIVMFIIGALLLPVAVIRSQTHPSPLLDLSLYKIRSFTVTSISVVFFGLAFLSGFLLNSIFLQELWEWSNLKSGLALSLTALISAFVATLSGPWSGSRGQREVISVGTLLAAFSSIHILVFATEEPNFWGVYFPSSVLLGIGVGLAIASFTSGSLRDVAPELFAIGNATSRTAQQMSYALGVTVLVLLIDESDTIESFDQLRNGYIWVASFFLLSSIIILFYFPSKFFGIKYFGHKKSEQKKSK